MDIAVTRFPSPYVGRVRVGGSTMDRREFTREVSLLFLGGVTITVSACGGGGYSNPVTRNPPSNDPTDEPGQISANHGHSVVVTSAELVAGAALLALDIKGGATHPHAITLPAAALVDIREGKPVVVQSTTNEGHDHLVTFNPESPAPPTRY